MSRRGRSGPTISLFSFQDIITSVTAIIMVITLLLAVDLVQRKESLSSDSLGEIAAELTVRLKQAEAELRALQSQAARTDDLVREAAATSPAELRNDISRRESVIVDLQWIRERLQQQQKHLADQEKAAAAEDFDLEPLRQKRAQIETATAELNRQIEQERGENRAVFTLPRGFQKEGWLAVIESDLIIVAPLGRQARPIEFRPTGLPLIGNSAADEFDSWIAKQNLRSAYFLLLIRPGASTTFENVDDLLTEHSVSHGFDVISQDMAILHPERGAAP